MQSIGAANGREAVRKNNNTTFYHFVRSQAAGGAQDSQDVDRNWIVSVDTLHMWSDRNSIRPYAKYRRREWPGSRSEKNKTALAMLGSHKTCKRPEWPPISNHPTVRFGFNLACDRIMIGSDRMQSYSIENGRESVRKKGICLAMVCEKSVSRFFFFL
jgi:hypothetical protein